MLGSAAAGARAWRAWAGGAAAVPLCVRCVVNRMRPPALPVRPGALGGARREVCGCVLMVHGEVGGHHGRLAQMAERSLSMREAPGSIPGLSSTALRVGGLYSSVGQSARLVSARSGVRTSLEAGEAFSCSLLFLLPVKNLTTPQKIFPPSLWLGPSLLRAGLVVDRTRDL